METSFEQTVISARITSLKDRSATLDGVALTKIQETIQQLEKALIEQNNQVRDARQHITPRYSLNAVVQELNLKAAPSNEKSSLQDQLRAQERDISQPTNLNNSQEDSSLSALQHLVAKREQTYLNDIINQAWQNRPENPGPINPHMLALKSLSLMRELSPAYLKHFFDHLDTMLWLDEQT